MSGDADQPSAAPEAWAAPQAWAAHGWPHDAAALLERQTLPHAWAHRWTTAPDTVALVDHRGTALTYGGLGRRAASIAQSLQDHGVEQGTRVLMSATPSVDLVCVHVALLLIGAVVVPVNTGFTTAEVGNIANEAAVAVAIMSDPSRCTECASSVTVLSLDQVAHQASNGPSGEEPPLTPPESLTSESPALLLFTSGTTGRPKGALLAHGNILASAQALVCAWNWQPQDRLVLCLPLFHMHGLGVGVHGTLLAGASAVVLPAFDEDAVFNASRAHAATLLFGVPTMWTRLLDHPRVSELATLRLCVSGSAALAPEVWDGLAAKGGQQIIERYGMTETVMLTSNPLAGARRAGTVGLALPGVDVAIHQPGPDAVGEIVVRGPNVFSGYLDRPDANAEAFLPNGWFRTGDLGRFDDDGYLCIVGRSKDLIITGGYNVYPSDVESVLRSHPGVAEVAVIGEPSDLWGETVTACVVPSNRHDHSLEETLLAFGAEHLAPYQRPRRIVLVEALPRNALGKVVKATLATTVAR